MTAAAVAAVTILSVYFRWSGSGVALRAASDDPVRAQAVGIDVDRLTGRVWAMAGTLSGTAATIAATATAPTGQATLDVHAMVAILTVALVARLSILPLAAAAAAAVGILSAGVVWSYGTSVTLDAVLLAVILVVLLLPRPTDPWRVRDEVGGWQLARDARPVPAPLRALTIVRAWYWAGAVAVAAGLVAYPWLTSPREINLGALVLIYAVVVVSLVVLTGWVGQISLGQFGIAAVGAYVAAAVPVPFPVAVALGALAGAAVAMLVGLPALRLRRLELAITSLAFASTVPTLLLSRAYLGSVLPDSLRRPSALGLDFADDRSFYYLSLVLAGVAVVGVIGLRRSRFARALIAGRDNEAASQCFGIDVAHARLCAFAVSGALAGAAGAMFAFHQRGVTPTAFAPEVSLTLFVTAVIGGLGTVVGPLLGGLYLGALTLGSATPMVTSLLTGGGGLLLVMAVPGGLAALATRARDSALRTVALRRGLVVPTLAGRSRRAQAARAPIAPRTAAGGRALLVPPHYRLGHQWALDPPDPRPDDPGRR
jgi:branched-chain amino acid transport system permease protein